MHSAYVSGLTLKQVGAPHGMSPQSVGVLFHMNSMLVRRRGEVKTRPTIAETTDDSHLVAFKSEWDKLDTTVKGTVSENYVKNRLSELGFDVWEPVTQNHRTDLIIIEHSALIRIQVKSATYDPRGRRFRACLSRHRRSGEYCEYSNSDVDFFIIHCAGMPRLEFYVIPTEAAKKPSINLLPHRNKFTHFSDFTWEAYRNAFHLLKVRNK